MLGRSFRLFRLLGFEVKVDLSWLVIAVLVAWSLAQGLFPLWAKGLSTAAYWWMGVAGALGLFVSIVFHELVHSLVARRYGIQMKGITLFIFGGVAEMGEEPASPKAEFMMAVAGPVSSVALGLVFWGFYLMGRAVAWPVPINGVLAYLGMLNGLLAGFNLLPAFPLDGGRVLRAGLWKWKKDLLSATRIASWVGSGFGIVLVGLGVLSVIQGDFIGGIWWFLIGMFLRGAAQSSYQQVVMRHGLEGLKVRRFMEPNAVAVPPHTTVAQLVDNYIYRHHFKMFPVVDDGRLVGCVTLRQVKDIPRAEWDLRTVGELARSCSPDNAISPDADAIQALSMMSRSQSSRLMVVEGDRLVGIIALKDMLGFLSLKKELET
ncbi:MAG: site-2 protease family protein [Chloroflexota bacterium]